MPPSFRTPGVEIRATRRSRRAAESSSLAARAVALIALAAHLTVHATVASAQADDAAALPPLSVRTSLYEVYASDSASLLATSADVEHAIAGFRRYFGEAPVPLAVVVIDAATGTVGVNDRSFRARGFQVLPWMSDRALQTLRDEHAAASGSVASPDAGGGVGRAVSHEACHVYLRAWVDRRQGRDGERTGLRGAYGHEDVPDWFDEAVATLCEPAHMQAQRMAELHEDIGRQIPLDELLTMRHPASARDAVPEAVARPGGATSAGAAAGGAPRIYRRDGRPMSAEEEERIRRAIAGDRSTGLRVERRDDDTTFAAPSVIAQVRYLSAAELEASGRTLAFYAQALGVARFVAARAGDAAIGRLADAFARRQSSAEALAALPGMPSDARALEEAWRAWLRTDGALE